MRDFLRHEEIFFFIGRAAICQWRRYQNDRLLSLRQSWNNCLLPSTPTCVASTGGEMIDESLNRLHSLTSHQVLSTYDPLLFDVENKFSFFETSQGFSFLLSHVHRFFSAQSERLVVFVPSVRVCRSAECETGFSPINLRWKFHIRHSSWSCRKTWPSTVKVAKDFFWLTWKIRKKTEIAKSLRAFFYHHK